MERAPAIGDDVPTTLVEPSAIPQLLLRIPDAARALGISRTTLYRLIGEEQIRVVHIGRSSRISLAELHAFVTRLPEDPPTYALENFPRVTAPRGLETTPVARPPEALEL